MTKPDLNVEFVEVYATHNFVEAQILEDLLTDHAIHTMRRTVESSPLPMSVGEHGEIRIAVPEDAVHQCLDLIQQALADGAMHADQAEILVMRHQ